LTLAREGGGLPRVGKRGVKPLSINLFPLSFEGEGDKGGEVSKHSIETQRVRLTNNPLVNIKGEL